MANKTPSAGALRAAKIVCNKYNYSAWVNPDTSDLQDAAQTIDKETGAADMAKALENLLYLAKNESNGAEIWAKYIQAGENALTKYRIPYPSEAQ